MISPATNSNPDDHPIERAATTEGLPVAVSLGPTLEAAAVPPHTSLIDGRVVFVALLAILIAIIAALIAQGLMHLIWFCTNISFYGKASFARSSPELHHLGAWVIAIPVIGAILVGFMARYGSKAIRGHGIPEAMEQVLLNQSRIPPRITFLKPISSAIAIGTGGPFGAEGPIIATGGALGSFVGQILRTTAMERKTLLAAGAAAGMAATFGSPVSAVLLAIELLLFEFRPRSLVPVALAASAAAAVRVIFDGTHPVFPMPDLTTPTGLAMISYILVGALVGVASVAVTRIVYAIEDGFEELPIHWMWWPALGAIAVGVVGYFFPKTLGVGYDNITHTISLSPGWTLKFIAVLCVMKFISWSIALGSGTSGGTLAPLFTIGSGIGVLLGAAAAKLLPAAAIDLRIAALVGMAAIFAGASRALLASVVFAFETTLQPLGLLPLLGGCTASFLVSCLLMRHSIMTEKIARRGVRVPAEYAADFLDTILVREVVSKTLVTLNADDPLLVVRAWMTSGEPGTTHQGFPVVDGMGHLVGVLTRRNLLDPVADALAPVRTLLKRPPTIVYSDATLRDAADHMVHHNVGRLPVLERETGKLIGIITRSDLLSAHGRRLRESREATRGLEVPRLPRFRRNGDRARST
jgi:H+/Cl- antiporter ClcA/CBS domain-containing protein